MLNNFFSKPVELNVGKKTFKFCSLEDFKFSLSGRTGVPLEKIIYLSKCSLDELKKESKTIKEIEKLFVIIIARLVENPQNITESLNDLDPNFFSKDNGWRLIISSLLNEDRTLDKFRHVALAKYMQYLNSRQDMIKYIYSEKKKKQSDSNLHEDKIETSFYFKKKSVIEDEDSKSQKQFSFQNNKMVRMLKGEHIAFSLKLGENIDLLLSKHKCRIVAAGVNISKFVDESGHSYELRLGKNIVGRDPRNDISIDPSLRDVSRVHLLVELDKSNYISMTDLSSHGTYIPAKYMKEQTVFR